MKRTPVTIDLGLFPAELHSLLEGAAVFDSSCSAAAQVYFVDREGGFYLKCAPAGSLAEEAKTAAFFHEKGLGAEVLGYICADRDYFLTRKLSGEDCIDPRYLADPARLAETTGTLLRKLHETDPAGAPVDCLQKYLALAEKPLEEQVYEEDLFPDNWGYRTPKEAFSVMRETAPKLKNDVLIHGDYCLPNIMLDDWRFTGFIDLDGGGRGDRHIDLFWGAWTLQFNLHTDRWCARFLDAYGRDAFDPEILKAIAAFEVFR